MDGPSKFINLFLDFVGLATGVVYLWAIYVYVM